MKLFSLMTALLFIGISAQATSLISDQQEILSKVEINGQPTDYIGVLNLDFVKNEIRVELYKDTCNQFTAKPGQITCMAMAELVTTIEAPLQTRGTSCGSSIYTGEIDQSPVDGFHTKIYVADHSSRLCKDRVAGEVEVKASKFNPWIGTTTHYYLVK
jgi:hypothetical protein